MTKTLIQLGANINYQEPSTSRTILDWGLCFICLYLINVSDNSNTNENSRSGFGNSYQLPKNITNGAEEAYSYLAGSFFWKTTEIEVYQVTPFIPYSVTFMHIGCLFVF